MALAKGKELTYSSALAELEGIIEAIESEDIDVDALAERVKRAAVLINFCKERLRGTDAEVKKIVTEME
jgi:exodeoxyribonuclease VII small subunit